jgi:hypothetical protein
VQPARVNDATDRSELRRGWDACQRASHTERDPMSAMSRVTPPRFPPGCLRCDTATSRWLRRHIADLPGRGQGPRWTCAWLGWRQVNHVRPREVVGNSAAVVLVTASKVWNKWDQSAFRLAIVRESAFGTEVGQHEGFEAIFSERGPHAPFGRHRSMAGYMSRRCSPGEADDHL